MSKVDPTASRSWRSGAHQTHPHRGLGVRSTGWNRASWLIIMLLGVGLALAGWFTFGPHRAGAQTLELLDPANCEASTAAASTSHLPSYYSDNSQFPNTDRADMVSDCKAMVAIRNHFLFGPNGNQEVNRHADAIIRWGRPGPYAHSLNRTRIDFWGGTSSPGGVGDFRGRVSHLYLAGLDLTGTIPPQIGDLENLFELQLLNNQFEGRIPAGLGQLDGNQLQRLDLGGNRLESPIPDLSANTDLRWFLLGTNKFTGPIPGWINSFSRLQRLQLNNNQFSGTIPDLSGLTRLQLLNLYNNQLTGEIPDLSNLGASLQNLALHNNMLTGEIPMWLGSMRELRQLRLDNNRLTGEIPPELGNTGTTITPRTPPNEPFRRERLQTLRLDNNRLTGEIPPELGLLERLAELRLDNNRLTGEIPPELGFRNSHWTRLSLSGNRLEGSIPATLGTMRTIRELRLDNNMLTGSIPSELDDLVFLTHLHLNNNNLMGTLPAGLADLTVLNRLQQLFLCNNPQLEVSGPQRTALTALGNGLCIGPTLRLGVAAGNGQAVLRWVFDEPGVERFEYRHRPANELFPQDGNGNDIWNRLEPSENMVTITGLSNGQEHVFQVRAIYMAGGRSFAATRSATPISSIVRAVGVADSPAQFSACVGTDVGTSSFTDIADSFAQDNIECIAQFGVTQGRTETQFAPGEVVSRWQMALFLARAAVPAGVELADPALDQGFTDIGGLSEEAQQAANALAQAGIMSGVTNTEFAPNSLVSRASMAQWLDQFLQQSEIGRGGTDPDDVRLSDTHFTDIADVSTTSYDSIRRIFQLGITLGTTPNTFSPDRAVTRAQMSAFITRMLGHTQARLPGVTIQSPIGSDPVTGDSLEILASVRDSNFQPVVDAYIDLFSYTDTEEAFANGECDTSEVTGLEGGTPCEIDSEDDFTDTLGDIDFTLDQVPAEATTIVAWTGDFDDSYDADTTEDATLLLESRKGAAQIIVADNLAEQQQVFHYGDTFQLTLQIADEDGNPLDIPDEPINIQIDETNSAGTVARSTRLYSTDNNGQVALTHTPSDPSRDDTQDATVRITIIGARYPLEYQTVIPCPVNVCTATWSNEVAVPTTLQLTQARTYTIATAGAINQVFATLTDQYGDPIQGEGITFTAGSITADILPRDTNRNGQASLAYNRALATSLREEITATHTSETDDDTAEVTMHSDSLVHLWVTELDADTDVSSKSIELVDTDNNRVIFLDSSDPDDLRFVNYDQNDQYNNGDTATSLANFEQDLPDATTISVSNYSQNADQVTALTLD